MSEDIGFVNMAGAKAQGRTPEVGLGMPGYVFTGKAHSNPLLRLEA